MRETGHKEQLKRINAVVYPSDWEELKTILQAENSNCSHWLRIEIAKKIKASKKKT